MSGSEPPSKQQLRAPSVMELGNTLGAELSTVSRLKLAIASLVVVLDGRMWTTSTAIVLIGDMQSAAPHLNGHRVKG